MIDLDARSTVLDAAERIAAAPADAPLALVVPAGAPFSRSAVFLDVARQLAVPRRLALVTAETRARSLAAAMHVPAYASLAALERDELDATERLGAQRRAALAAARGGSRTRSLGSPGRAAGIAASLFGALAILLAVVLPSATVTVAPRATPMPAQAFSLRAGPGGDIAAQPLSATITTTVSGTATGSRTDETKATGSVRFTNQTTNDIRLPKGTAVRTTDNVRFVTTEEKTVPRSFIVFLTVVPGQVEASVEAVVPGAGGNVEANRITVSGTPAYVVTNPQKTAGGETKKIPLVKAEDYTAATSPEKVRAAFAAETSRQQSTWQAQAGPGISVYALAPAGVSSQSPLADVVGKEVTTFEVTISGVAQGFAVASDQPAKAALERYRTAAAQGSVLDDASAKFEVTQSIAQTGVSWQIAATGRQLPRIDEARVRAAIAGRDPADAKGVLEGFGLTVRDLRLEPEWWPRLPLLDVRIRIN
ncbi:MAG TPA: baseplate J/gp47 family protein [Candidatus Limnocylindria bacterium]